ncbi:hypothetical protein BFJ66_g13714 [Fusarium oxysporum f. sp. cepae]|uniref:3-oxoacyl-[acyl-carrier protein] reductase n=1 Tax=Fusarium oxysporum f. sp. cepae TaxID=396571 RepID=A0A3L6N0N7_FUSOX|nr:hypothetical protein BFJ65_g15359 [Fusarium oxysporum f. sp. cepae]RKK26794.1 hypothetical protein BFJ67_g16455 [Fusarium oxysporum f. sp. cepae]RKK35970.1 hypothetical protein BFJ66_g13714 [Fusarium oxysporum f. sp. cepae]RKK81748.1 hypothetical protein BFJ71_g15499 [Fusarium oxysporum]
MATPQIQSGLSPRHGKVALVSGSSSGLGAAIAREFSRRGCHVIINYPNSSEASAAQNVLESLEGECPSIIVQADLSTIEGPRELANAAAAHFGKVDFLINNAGVNALDQIDAASDDEILRIWDKVVNVNGRGTMLLTRAVLPILTPKNSRIINIGSGTSRDPDPDLTIYAGSKGMIESFTRCWARYFPRKYGCTVNTVAPGPTTTEKILSLPDNFLDAVWTRCKNIPVAPRMGDPNELAWVVATLCEESAGWLNGLYIPVTGGDMLN